MLHPQQTSECGSSGVYHDEDGHFTEFGKITVVKIRPFRIEKKMLSH